MVNKLYKKIMKALEKSSLHKEWVVKTCDNVVFRCNHITHPDKMSVTFYCDIFRGQDTWSVTVTTMTNSAMVRRNEDVLVNYTIADPYVSLYDMFQMMVRVALRDCIYNA